MELPRTSYGAEGRRRSVLSADSLKANVHEEGFDRSPGQGRKQLLRAGSGKSPLDEPVWRWHYILCVAALPQLDRGSDYESERHRFESCTPHQSNFKVLSGAPFLLGTLAGIRTRWGRETEQTRERLPASVRGRGGARSCGRRRRTRILYAAGRTLRCSSGHLFCLGTLAGIRTSLEARAPSFRERRMSYRRKGAIAWLKPSHNGNKNRERESRSA